MPSIPRFVISLALVFATQVESRAFPLAEANDVHGLRARQVATSATATATDVGSVAAGNLLGAFAAGASASSASVAAASASAASVASTVEAEGSICNGDTDRNMSAWVQFDIGDWFKNQYVKSTDSPNNGVADHYIGQSFIPSTIGTTWMEVLSRAFKN